jgi:hypothetical protein
MFSTNHNDHSNRKSSWRSLRQTFTTPVLLAAIFSGTQAISVSAQDAAQVRANVASRLGVKAEALTAKSSPEAYQANPTSDLRQSSDVIVSSRTNSVDNTKSTSGVSDMVGTTSVENFQGTQSNLSYTHESADGFRNYFTTWYTPNFARRDSAVSVWQFHDFGTYNYDLWTSGGTDYGVDGVRVMFHSGHGGMAAANTFFAPMGANWSGYGWNAVSTNMALGGNYYSYGDERLRYLFWDTCNSVMVSGGHNPYSTWGVRSKGIRMVFGYETVSIDSPNYGKYFWEEWNKGKSLSTAFLDASWRINTRQSPAVVAFGANQTEATDRLYNERYLYPGAVANNWGQWRWYYARSAASFSAAGDTVTVQRGEENGEQNDARQKPLQIPARAQVRQVAERGNSNEEVLELSRAFGIQLDDASLIQERPSGIRAVKAENATLAVEANGNFELLLDTDETTDKGENEVEDQELIRRANDLAGELSVLKGQEYRVSMIRDTKESGGFEGSTLATRTVEKTIIIDQLIDGVAFIDPEAGHLEITFDARSGQATRVRSSLRQIKTTAAETSESVQETSLAQVRQAALQRFAGSVPANSELKLEVVPDSEEVGYQMIDGKAVPVYRALVNTANSTFSRPQLAIIPLVKGN